MSGRQLLEDVPRNLGPQATSVTRFCGGEGARWSWDSLWGLSLSYLGLRWVAWGPWCSTRPWWCRLVITSIAAPWWCRLIGRAAGWWVKETESGLGVGARRLGILFDRQR
ncbi:uncharacterized protein BDZ99DRAFT_90697 [Mytilinidion resinicola]|uniref:Uncharacterized protein n=1 Tax=Mytilinidion resinicola TaxID=574789 RepID=A0A6A6YE98_9PEZI|nr:uncharacterized protein BDZ99DRAFT_90697 [Mytilinidion resinicola]KAF2807060.1 hypothetical protein BDZ99DRAFT_90697 [Mytilinidion resinicola]